MGKYNDRPYKIGKGKPPEHSRFKPGQSGNPRGRPKRNESHSEIVARVMSKPLAIKMGGKNVWMNPFEAMLSGLLHESIRHSTPAKIRAVRDILREYGPDLAEEQAAEAKRAAGEVVDRIMDIFERTVPDDVVDTP